MPVLPGSSPDLPPVEITLRRSARARRFSLRVAQADGKVTLSLPARARAVAPPDWLWPRTPPVRQRKTVADSWIELTITEGRNRQVRRMTAAVGLPTLRLLRIAVGPHRLEGLRPGLWREEPL